jgi:hypothetical protein
VEDIHTIPLLPIGQPVGAIDGHPFHARRNPNGTRTAIRTAHHPADGGAAPSRSGRADFSISVIIAPRRQTRTSPVDSERDMAMLLVFAVIAADTDFRVRRIAAREPDCGRRRACD